MRCSKDSMRWTTVASGVVDPTERKEVKTMTYVKPEIEVLGDAGRVIQGSKRTNSEPVPNQFQPAIVLDSALDDKLPGNGTGSHAAGHLAGGTSGAPCCPLP